MKIFGIDVPFSRKASVSPVAGVSIQKNLQKTEPSLPLKSAFPRQEIGDSGTRLIHGIITEEYNPQLQGIEGIKIYDLMRKSDGTVRAAILACTLPIMRSKWFVNPANDEQKNQDIAEFVEHALFDWLEDMSWDDVVRQALLSVPLGVMLFEKVYGTKEHDGKTYVTLKKLAPRLPKSILSWELVDHTFGIQQIRQDGVLAQIPGSKLLIFVNEREGDNWFGNSMLRSAYKHWYYKDGFYKIDAIAYERQGVGVPMITMPVGYTKSDEAQAVIAMQNLRSNEVGYLLLPPGYKAEFMNMGSSTTRDPEKSINHHNKEILQSVLAQFLELGATRSGGGSRALSQDHSDLFLKAIEAIANNIISVINKDLIPELVDLNFNDVSVYPVLDYSGISKVDVTALGTAYSQLVTAGALNPTDDDQQYLRAMMGLPPRSQEDIDAAANEEPNMEEQTDHLDIEEDGEPDPKGPQQDKQVDDAAGKSEKKAPTTKSNSKTDIAVKKKTVKTHDHLRLKRKFKDEVTGFTSWRPLTFAEQKVSWEKIQKTMDDMEALFNENAKVLLNNAKDAFMDDLHAALKDGDTKAVQSLGVNFVDAYKTLLKNAMRDAYTYGKNNASTEMGVLPPPNSAESLANIDLIADTVANKTASDIEATAKILTSNAITNGQSILQAAGEIDAELENAITKSVENASAVMIGQNINIGRNDVFERNSDRIYGLQRSELLDETTCNFCLSMDGLVVDVGDDWASSTTFHSNCRGIWVEILKDEENPPEITGIPDVIGDYYQGRTNGLVQPPKPITRPGTLADEFVKSKKKK